jgi:subtilisin family serine protease
MVWETLAADGEAEILVVLWAQADLSGADVLPTKAAKGRYVYEALRAVAQASQRDLRSALDALDVEYQPFFIVNAIKVRGGSALIHSLSTRDEVARIVPNPRITAIPEPPTQVSGAAPNGIEPNLVRVHADDVWALGYTGRGVVVAGQDTGYDWDHPALKSKYRGWNGVSADHDYNWHDAIHNGGGDCGPDSAEPCDDHGHGTHTMGIIVGDDGANNQVGMAPDAKWVGCRNMDEGVGTPATYMECFEFFLAPYPLGGTVEQGIPELAPHVVNNSWSCPPSEGCDAGALEASVEALRQAGIMVVVSAGNRGSSCGSMTDPPAIYSQSCSVGAFDPSTDQIAAFSGRGPVTYGGWTTIKPDIAAPGVNIRSSLSGGGYGPKYGTSMASPHVAGAVALLLSAAPDYAGHVAAIEQALYQAAEPQTTAQGCGGDGPADVPNNVWGWGILDALAAVELVMTEGRLQGTVKDAHSGAPIAGASVTVAPSPGAAGSTAFTDPMGHYTLTLAANTYDVIAQANGYAPQTMTNVAVTGESVTTQDFALVPLLRYYLPLCVRDL